MNIDIEKIFAEVGRLHVQVMALQEQVNQANQKIAELQAAAKQKE
jgi:hypothetical protein